MARYIHNKNKVVETYTAADEFRPQLEVMEPLTDPIMDKARDMIAGHGIEQATALADVGYADALKPASREHWRLVGWQSSESRKNKGSAFFLI